MTFRSASPLKIAVLVLAAIILAFLVFVLCLTQPRWGTPFANWSLKVWGPEDARVDSAHLKFPQITTVAAHNVSVPGRMQADDFEASANILDFCHLSRGSQNWKRRTAPFRSDVRRATTQKRIERSPITES